MFRICLSIADTCRRLVDGQASYILSLLYDNSVNLFLTA
jgi:hypothetical protein